MHAVTRTLIAIATVALSLTTQAEAATAPRLQMLNGDYYTGRLVDSAAPGVLAWRADVGVRPFRFALANVAGVQFDRGGDFSRPKGDVCVELAEGDVLFGTLEGLSADTVTLTTDLLGRLEISRRSVARLHPWGEESGVAYIGPSGLDEWKAQGDRKAWTEQAGQPTATAPGVLTLRDVEIPAYASIELEISWRRKADFTISFGGAPPASIASEPVGADFMIDEWSESVVLLRERQDAADLALVKRVERGAGRLELRVHYDRAAGVVTAYTLGGEMLARVHAPDGNQRASSGVTLINREGDMRLDRLMIRRWGGPPPTVAHGEGPSIQLHDATALPAAEAVYDGDAREFVVPAGAGERRIPLSEVLSVIMPERDGAPTGRSLRVSLRDGTRLSGELEKVEAGRVHLKHPGVGGRLSVAVADVHSLVGLRTADVHGAVGLKRLNTLRPPHARPGRLETAGCLSHGVLVDAEASDQASCLAWLPEGSSASSALRPDTSGRIIYRTPPPPRPKAEETRREATLWGRLAIVAEAITEHQATERAAASPFGELLWLRAGDRIPCRVLAINERGVRFETPVLDATFVPHDAVKAWERRAGAASADIEEEKLHRLLTLPRRQRENPPTHVIESTAGDFLRGRLESVADGIVSMLVRLETKRIPTDKVARVLWLDEPPTQPANPDDPGREDAEQAFTPSGGALLAQAVRSDGVRITLHPDRFENETLHGASGLLGACSVNVGEVDQLKLGDAIADTREGEVYTWRLRDAPNPRFVSAEGASPDEPTIAGRESALVGQVAPEFTLELAGGGEFRLSEQRGRVVVLDFWASWCGWCMQSMPQLDAMAEEYGDQITWVAVNLQEDRQTITEALERLGVRPRVAMDIDGATAEKYQVTAIPQTVVIDASGTVSRVFIGGGPNAVAEIQTGVRDTLEGDSGEQGSDGQEKTEATEASKTNG